MPHLVRISQYTFNLENVTEIVDYGDKLFVGFGASWQDPGNPGKACFSGRFLSGNDADVMRRYIARIADDAAAQIR